MVSRGIGALFPSTGTSKSIPDASIHTLNSSQWTKHRLVRIGIDFTPLN